MGNLSKHDEDYLVTNEIVFNQGKFLNIENVLNKLHQSNQQNEHLKQYLNSS